MADTQQLIPRDHRSPRGKRGHRLPDAGRPEWRWALRKQPLIFRRPEAPPIEAPQPKEARAARGPCVTAQTSRKRRRLEIRAKRRANRGVYSGQ